MNIHDEVTIICDNRPEIQRLAIASRAGLEALGLNVSFHFGIHRAQIAKIFSGETSTANNLLVWSHGIFDEDGGPGIRLECLDQVEGRKGWTKANFDLTAETIPALVKKKFDLVVSAACSSGHETVGAAFMKAGVQTYIAPTKPADLLSSYVFFMNFFLLSLQRRTSEKDSNHGLIARSNAFDSDRPGSAKLYRCYSDNC